MRKLLLLLVLTIGIGNCGEATTDDPTSPGSITTGSDDRCYHNGNRLHEGPQGGCYYINSNGNKTYVDRAECAGC